MRRTGAGAGAVAVMGCTGEGGAALTASEVFLHGVASGDPLPDAVILWTRVTPEADGPVEVEWRVCTDPEARDVVVEGTFVTGPERDYTVKVDVTGLSPATTYYYRFRAPGGRSLVGRTRTAPQGAVERARFGVVSCASLGHGWFHVYRHLADEDLDAVLHLGDYIYEYGTDDYGSERVYEPSHEIVSLADYRMRYAQYRRDRDLQAIHQQHAFVCIWDDHETTNDSYRDGAENHQADEGAWAERKAAAYQAYMEWLPVREQEVGKIWRSFAWGQLADLFMLDTRLWGRDAQPEESEEAGDPTRQLLGEDQERWLSDGLLASTATWKLIGQQVMVGQLNTGSPTMFSPFNLDQWDGYAAARVRLLDLLASVDDPVVLTGDIHSHWAIELTEDPFDPETYDPATGEGSVGVEFVTSGVSSPALPDERLGGSLEEGLRRNNPHMKHINFVKRGWITLDVTPSTVQADFWEIDGVEWDDTGDATFRTAFRTTAGSRRLEMAAEPTSARANAAELAPEMPLPEIPVERQT
ncbi:MAG: alkaline phosphatase D family protein [Polyangiales bacterium]